MILLCVLYQIFGLYDTLAWATDTMQFSVLKDLLTIKISRFWLGRRKWRSLEPGNFPAAVACCKDCFITAPEKLLFELSSKRYIVSSLYLNIGVDSVSVHLLSMKKVFTLTAVWKPCRNRVSQVFYSICPVSTETLVFFRDGIHVFFAGSQVLTNALCYLLSLFN